MTRRRAILAVAVTGPLAFAFGVYAQVPNRSTRIGLLASSNPAMTPQILGALRDGLREHGYVEGRNVTIEYRWSDENERLVGLAAELVRRVDVIVAWATPASIAAKRASSAIPIVFVGVADPVGSGLVASLARPGGNVTGVSNVALDLSAKLVELLVHIVPNIDRFAALRNATNPSSLPQLKEIEEAAGRFALRLQQIGVRVPEDLEMAFKDAIRESAKAIIFIPDPMFLGQRQRIADLAIRNRLPTAFARRENVEVGGLIAYGSSLVDQIRHATKYVDKILKGALPSDLPVEQPTTFELVINLKTAKALSLTIPQSVLARTDEVIQ